MSAGLVSRIATWNWGRVLMALLLLGAAASTWWQVHAARLPDNVQKIVLLLPDAELGDPVQLRAWQDAAEELGIHLDPQTASQVMRDGRQAQGTAFILPDTLHRRMSDVLIGHLRERVRAGDTLMLVHDAGLSDIDGRYREDRSRLSDLAGVQYGLYGELKTGMLRDAPAWVLPEQVQALGIPPGKLVRGAEGRPQTSAQPAPGPDEPLSIAGYVYGELKYPTFVTRGAYDGTRLMTTTDGSLLAGLHRFGAGRVLFVNLPLTQLKVRTDGLLLHSFLQYFAERVVGAPQLSPMPQGRGAVVMNWHIDDRKALPALERAAEMGAFKQGPYSIHFTAGPDVNEEGDGKGMDLSNNPQAQEWVQRLGAAGHEIGSHGGWIHNWFGSRADKLDREVVASLIERNSSLLLEVGGRPVREYSAPVGNHPMWTTAWLKKRGMQSYYFTGNTGMAPTRSYQDGVRPLPDIWSYPVLNFGVYASFEEAKADQLPEIEVAAWLTDVNRFCADHRTLRLVYFHPIGLVMYPQAFQRWLESGKELADQGRLRWMTMAQYSAFANQRLRTRWTLTDSSPSASLPSQQLEAHHPQSLDGMTWLLPRDRYAQPTVTSGQAVVDEVDGQWRVVAGTGTGLRLHLPLEPRSARKPS
ncbi:polysaccharide deacetylase family protein [Sphaerotilus sp.]|uniref:polysaccharide deacetylase family protein n=1 Tax=Sphaerotilus sp. TaxID=2093942 RepID=UPI00286E709F|nr:polysaccharide deacetylase family protein [Sphaerotilus sp.]